MSFKHKWIFYALSILIASLAAHESIRLMILIVPILFLLNLKKSGTIHLILIIIFSVSAYFYFDHTIMKTQEPLNFPAKLVWTDEYKISGDKLRGFMKDENGRKIYVVYELKSEEEKNAFAQESLVGKSYLTTAELVEPSEPNHPYAFDMKNYLMSKGAIGIAEVQNWQYVGTKNTIPQKISKQRFRIKTHIEEKFPSSLAAEAQSLLIGLQENVDEETTRAYQTLGITHLFAISGLHIAIIALIIYQGLLRLRVRKEFATIVLLVALPIYAVLAGGAPSVWRSVLIVEIMMIGRLKGKISAHDALAISFILFVFLEPWSIYQVGFQLSYLATISLIYSGPLISRSSSWLIQSFLITFVCQLLVYPLLLYHFYEISLSSFIVNIFFVPLFSFIILPINMILLAASYLPTAVPEILFQIYEPARAILTKIIDLLQSIPYQMWNPGKPSIYLALFAFICVLLTFYLLDSKARLWKVCLSLFIPIVILQTAGKITDDLIITFVNVGQGDCVVIELPYKEEVYMIDTGGFLRFEQEKWKEKSAVFEVGRDIVVPFLKGKGIQKIDKLILTHADSDHMEGAEEILQEIPVNEIHVSPNSILKGNMSDLLKEAMQQKIPVKEQIGNAQWKNGDIIFHYLWPNDTNYEGNDDSLVLNVAKGEFEALFMGDVEEQGEKQILKQYPDLEKIDLLKAGHHGSKTSSSEGFIEKMQPALTVFSAGKNNRYGHPHKEVVERFEKLGLPTIGTFEKGTIEIRVDENKMKVLSGLN
ncbi:DNA internalization-related competence protein ComEC/Rec2 [Lysinibacillus yapensis]|uniref:DNA internalization-related competence protein ComEC/Rec2 n=1 Tax=Ureibacillus yapensis TaxID=2304605 RepID=A0A396SB63_9BACL|nr:DNA internalization-related competence protein ComEC/Rec2 [Lysinibacillus yapensis]RHW38608.1 DNA internalization-related competence protein ComEC/Rec2 [Lysinibacillus yapensis]